MSAAALRSRLPARLAATGALAGAYFLAARLGLSLGMAEQVSVVWPPSGIALAALLIGGRGLWPGIWVGALAANLAANEPAGTAIGIAAGNTLEALAAAWLLGRVGFSHSLEGRRDVLALGLLAALLATTVAATIGVTSLCLGGVHPWSRFGPLLWVYWLGDAMGILLVVPVLLTWQRWRSMLWSPARGAEYLLLLAGLIATSHSVFTASHLGPTHFHPYVYLVFPFVIWAALRFEQRGASLAVLTAAVVATWATVRGTAGLDPRDAAESLVYLQTYMGVVALTGLTLAAATSERNRSERQRSAGHEVARILNEVDSLEEAVPRIMQAVCECLDFDLGALWIVDRQAEALRCVELWHRPGVSAPRFAAVSRQRTFATGVGLPGRVWSSARPAWIEDVTTDDNFPRAGVAAEEGLHGAFGFPIVLAGAVRGVIEFFSREIRRPDGNLLQLLSATGSQIGQFVERQQAEAAVRTSEARKAGVLASVLDAIITIDHQGRLIEFNAGAERIFGVSAADALGREMAELIIPPRLRERHRAGLARYVETGESRLLDRRLELTAMRADGTEFPVELTIRRVIGSLPPMITGYLRDITDSRRVEQERARLLEAEQQARVRAEKLAQDLRDQQEAKDRFLAMLGHELRNPLAPVVNGLEILRRGCGPAEAQRLFEMMSRQVRHMARLLDDLLDVSRIQRGTIAMQTELVDLVMLVAHAVEANRPMLDEHGHRLALALPQEPCWIDGDPTRLEQIVSNLLVNAARYTPPGGEVSVTLEREGGAALLCVRDNGIGIRPELLARIFEAFQQADRVAGNAQHGLGLGLTLAKKLTELHGGTIAASSPGLGQGSEFSVRLPLCAAPAARPAPPARPVDGRPPAAAAAAGQRILVVDDNQDSADSLALMLKLSGHDTRVAYDGPQALEESRSFRPTVALIDVELPKGMNGYELGQRLLEGAGPDRPVLVAVTGYGKPEDRERSRAAGFEHHLVKPVDPGELARVLQACGRA